MEKPLDDNPTDQDQYGVGIWFQTNSGKTQAVANRFSGWKVNVMDADMSKANRDLSGPAI